MEIGYACVSPLVPAVDTQLEELAQASCTRIFTDSVSAAKAPRTGLAEALGVLCPGDTLVVWRLDRLGYPLPHLLETLEALQARRVGFKSLTERFDTTTGAAEQLFPVFAALAQLERNLLHERVQVGLITARSNGGVRGRPRALDATQIAQARTFSVDQHLSRTEICRRLNISRMTLWRYLHESQKQELPKSNG